MSVLLESYTGSDSYSFGMIGTLIGQTFVVPSGYDRVDYVNLPLYRIGSVAGNVTAHLFATSGGVPTGSSLGSATYTANSISTSGTNWYTFNWSDIAVTPGARYAIVFDGNGTSSSSTVAWKRGSTASYSGGQGFYKLNGGSWLDWGRDFGFYVYGSISVVVPTVTTAAIGTITSSSGVLGGNVTSDGGGTVSTKGYVISSNTSTPSYGVDRTIGDGTGTGAFSETVGNLTPATQYYYRAYGVNEAGVSYGSIVSFITSSTTPIVTSGSASSISSTTATCSGNATSDGGSTITERGIVWNTSTAPNVSDNKVISGTGTGSFNANLTGMTAETLIYWRAYVINANGTVYGTEYTFTTKNIIKYWGQSFTTESAGVLNKVSLYLKETLGASSTAKLRIYSDDSGSPDTVVATATKTVSGSTYQWYDFTFNYTVDATTDYWIVLEDPYTVGSYYQYWGANSVGTYGMVMYKTATGSWTEIADATATFKVYIQPSLTVDYDISVDYKKRYL